ncbi:hypothetical protein GQX74_010421, partial [Glossina fuscipes]
ISPIHLRLLEISSKQLHSFVYFYGTLRLSLSQCNRFSICLSPLYRNSYSAAIKGVRSGNLNRFCGRDLCTRAGGVICLCLDWPLKPPPPP